jgi:hypothetical protein
MTNAAVKSIAREVEQESKARAKLAIAMASLTERERRHDEERTAKTVADYRSDFCIAMAYVVMCKDVLGIDVSNEDRQMDHHRKKCNAPLLEWNE